MTTMILWKAVDDLDSRMEAMEQAMKSANTDIDALRNWSMHYKTM